MYIIPDGNMAGIITAMMAQLGTALTGVLKVHLYTNNLSPTKTTVLADFSEATNVEIPGYTAASVNWFAGAPFRRPDGGWEDPDSVPDPSFVATGPPPSPQVVYGFFCTDSTNLILLGSGIFAAPFTFSLSGDGFTLEGNPVLAQTDDSTLALVMPDWNPV